MTLEKRVRSFFLLQQRKLARQEDNERDLHDLGGLNGDGKILQKADAEPFADVVHAEPGAVAVSRQAKGRAQQQNEAEIERQQPLPFFPTSDTSMLESRK